MKCFECGGAHFKRDCPKLIGEKVEGKRCFICNDPGHFANVFPKKKKVGESQQQDSAEIKPQATGRVFAMSAEEATKPALGPTRNGGCLGLELEVTSSNRKPSDPAFQLGSTEAHKSSFGEVSSYREESQGEMERWKVKGWAAFGEHTATRQQAWEVQIEGVDTRFWSSLGSSQSNWLGRRMPRPTRGSA
ncbi:hypothetical protein VIGAN_08249100 [Vigna angularis var. angularis]|uniref:CCHC-type domain-containing protein n=1 Tax=Vigna angularis var. angularis TaxID=157739 RepID=A0A0S3SSB8_PHAAN|nr:hypothetical protein VIGAN_08249100 [Vigna angularis var. angularis]